MLRKRLAGGLRVVLSVLTLGILISQVGGRDLLNALRGADVGLLVLAWALFLLGVVVRVFRWRALLHGLGLRPPFWLLLRLYLVGGFFNAFLPSGFGGDVVRVVELGQHEEDRAAVLGTVLVDRLTGILSLLAMGLAVLPFAKGLTPAVCWVFAGVAGAGLLAGALVLEGRLLRRLTPWLPTRVSLAGEGALAKVYAAVTGSGSRALWVALGLSTVFNLINVLVHWVCGRAVGLELQSSAYFVVVPLLALALLLPISVGGLGARDWVGQLLLVPSGVPDTLSAAWTLSVWAVTAAAGLVGGLIYLYEGLAGLARRREESASTR